MPSTSASVGAAAPTVRHVGPDLARGMMLLLIAMAYAGVYAGTGFSSPPESGLADQIARFGTVMFLDNRAFPMFAILFGYGLTWTVTRALSKGHPETEVRRTLRRRGFFLLLFGAVHAFLVFPGEILTSYGLCALVIGWLLFRPQRTLVRAAWILTVAYSVTVSLAMLGMAAAGDDESFGIAGYTSPGDWIERLVGLPFGPIFIAVAYPLFLAVVLGFWAGGRRLLEESHGNGTMLSRIAWGGIAVSMAGAVPAAFIAVDIWTPGVTTDGMAHSLQVLTGVAGGAGYAAAFGLLGSRMTPPLSTVVAAIIAVGQRSLTFYILNSALVAVVLHPDLVGIGSHVGMAGALAVALAVWIVTTAVALWMRRTNRPGPLDVLMRRLVYRKTSGSGDSS